MGKGCDRIREEGEMYMYAHTHTHTHGEEHFLIKNVTK